MKRRFTQAALLFSMCSSAFAVAAAQGEVVTTVAFEDSFETGLANWTAEGLWHLETAAEVCDPGALPLPHGNQVARYGDIGACTYWFAWDDHKLVLATPISIPSTALSARLKYSTYEHTECIQSGGGNCGWDHRWIMISTNGGLTWTVVSQGGPEGYWRHEMIDISSYRGSDIVVAFRFDVIDPVLNSHPGWYLDDVSIEFDEAPAGTPGATFCFGDGSGEPCPCGNGGAAVAGCANSTGNGATLLGVGTNSLSANDFGLNASSMLPNQVATLFAGQNRIAGGAGIVLGDGLRCAGGTLQRLGPKAPNASGAATWGPGLIGSAGWSAGDVRRFQVWYRDPVNSPCAGGFNTTNGYEVIVAP